jgi:hypothetical protein
MVGTIGVKLLFSRWVLGPDITTKFQVLTKEKAYFRLFRWVLEPQITRELYAYGRHMTNLLLVGFGTLPYQIRRRCTGWGWCP